MQTNTTKPTRRRTPLGDLVTSQVETDEATGQHREIVEIETSLSLVQDSRRFDDNNPGRNWERH